MNIKYSLEGVVVSMANGAKIRERMAARGVVLSIHPLNKEQYELLMKNLDDLRQFVEALANNSKSPHKYVVNIVRLQ